MWGLLGAGVGLLGALLGSSANSNAQSQINAAASQAEAIDAGIASNAEQAAAPGIAFLKNTMAYSNQLTPAEKAQLSQVDATTTNELHGSDLAGSGQAAAAAFKSGQDNYTNQALQQNQENAQSAATTLTGLQSAADQALETEGNTMMNAATADANAGLASASLWSQALGRVGSSVGSFGNNYSSNFTDINGQQGQSNMASDVSGPSFNGSGTGPSLDGSTSPKDSGGTLGAGSVSSPDNDLSNKGQAFGDVSSYVTRSNKSNLFNLGSGAQYSTGG